jgi:YfiH family protein
MSAVSVLRAEWPAPARVRAALSLRDGGVSRGPYASLNLAAHVGDEPAAVAANRARLRSALALPQEPLWLTQLHGTRVHDADLRLRTHAAWPPEADAAVTRADGTVLAVLIADCMPVLLCRRDAAGIAIAHAGWRGLAGGVVEAALGKLGAKGDEVLAWLGPVIGPKHFEVGDEVREAFCGHDARACVAFAPNARGRWQCDLHQLAMQRLAGLGVCSVYGANRCTFEEPDCFYSYRRDGTTGRLAALIWMEPRFP